MRTLPTVVALLAAITLVSGSAAATAGSIEMRFDNPGQITVLIVATATGADAQQTRAQIDQSGDNNQQVSAAEVDAFEQQLMSLFQQFGGDDPGEQTGGNFTIDGKGPNDFDITKFDLKNAEGPVSSTNPVTINMDMRLMFPVTAADSHMVHFESEGQEQDEEQGGWDFQLESAKMTAPGGYIFSSVTGLPGGASVSGNKKSIDFGNSYMQPQNVNIVMAKGGGGGGVAPNLGLVLAAACLLGVAFIRRRAA